jgi:hypothetical protein
MQHQGIFWEMVPTYLFNIIYYDITEITKTWNKPVSMENDRWLLCGIFDNGIIVLKISEVQHITP